MFVLKNCRLIPELTEGFDGKLADIVVDGKYIKDILPAGEQSFADMESIDVQGKTVLPGFFDLHAHLMWKDQDFNALLMRSQNQYLLDCIEFNKYWLQMGYTTVRDCGSDYYAGCAVRDAVNSGVVDGARIITSGKCVTPTTRGNSTWGSLYEVVDDPAQMMAVCRREMEQGCDFIKYMITGAVLNEGGSPGAMICTLPEIQAITHAAETLGTYVAAHCHGTEGIKSAIIGGIKTIEHATYMDEECVDLILQKGNSIATIPTASITYTLTNGLFPGIKEEFVTKATDAIKNLRRSVNMSIEAGIHVGWGTDLDLDFARQYPGLEFTARHSMGIDPMTLLKQATIGSAQIIGMDDILGTVKVGKYADLVVIDGNPDENMDVMKTLPAYVFKEGKRFIA